MLKPYLSTDAVVLWVLILAVSSRTAPRTRQALPENGWVISVHSYPWLKGKRAAIGNQLIGNKLIGSLAAEACWEPTIPSYHARGLPPPTHFHFLCVAWQEIGQVITESDASSPVPIGCGTCVSCQNTCLGKSEKNCCQGKFQLQKKNIRFV